MQIVRIVSLLSTKVFTPIFVPRMQTTSLSLTTHIFTHRRGSGFDRGHLANAANQRWSQAAMQDTFFLSNMSPQVAQLLSTDCQVGKGFNRDIWNRLEQWVRGLDEYARVTVMTGPLFMPRTASDGKAYITYQVVVLFTFFTRFMKLALQALHFA